MLARGELAPNMAFLWLTHARALLRLAGRDGSLAGRPPLESRMSSIGWEHVQGALGARGLAGSPEPVAARAAVAAVLREGEAGGLELLFIRRAEHEGDPWSGHISFPGGRSEPGDDDLVATAVRETAEETGLDLAGTASFSALSTRSGPWPAGGRSTSRSRPSSSGSSAAVDGAPNHEVVSLHWLPLERLLAPESRSTMEYQHEGTTLELPCLRIDGLVIWGLTYRMFENLREQLTRSRVEEPADERSRPCSSTSPIDLARPPRGLGRRRRRLPLRGRGRGTRTGAAGWSGSSTRPTRRWRCP